MDEFKRREGWLVVQAACLSGIILSTLMNSLECFMYARMAEPEGKLTMKEVFNKHGISLFTKGLETRIVMTSGYSIMIFNCLYYLGKVFNCDILSDHEY